MRFLTITLLVANYALTFAGTFSPHHQGCYGCTFQLSNIYGGKKCTFTVSEEFKCGILPSYPVYIKGDVRLAIWSLNTQDHLDEVRIETRMVCHANCFLNAKTHGTKCGAKKYWMVMASVMVHPAISSNTAHLGLLVETLGRGTGGSAEKTRYCYNSDRTSEGWRCCDGQSPTTVH